MNDQKETPPPTTEAPETPANAATEPVTPATAETTQDNTDHFPDIQEQLRLAELKAEEHHDAWMRAKAETENVRRRAQEDISKAHKFAAEKFASELLAVKDSLEAALKDESADTATLRAGVELTLRQLVAAFEKAAVTEVDPAGEKFDPHRHQAIGMLESEQEPNTVVAVLQKGYLIADRVLRPAMVMVAKAKE
jgi:molecular chaperone GrpE